MGYYIETAGQLKNKAQYIVDKYDAIILDGVPPKSMVNDLTTVLICVVDNGPFEAAGVCYDIGEYEVFTQPADGRPKQWLLIG